MRILHFISRMKRNFNIRLRNIDDATEIEIPFQFPSSQLFMPEFKRMVNTTTIRTDIKLENKRFMVFNKTVQKIINLFYRKHKMRCNLMWTRVRHERKLNAQTQSSQLIRKYVIVLHDQFSIKIWNATQRYRFLTENVFFLLKKMNRIGQ